jgi:hypothetical protein
VTGSNSDSFHFTLSGFLCTEPLRTGGPGTVFDHFRKRDVFQVYTEYNIFFCRDDAGLGGFPDSCNTYGELSLSWKTSGTNDYVTRDVHYEQESKLNT